jgi:short-subunit dehydrogenase
MTASNWDRALIVGASSGIGRAMAEELAAHGTRLALVARRADLLRDIRQTINQAAGEQRAWSFTHDVADADAVPALFQEIATTLGGLDLVVYAAGIMPDIGPDEYPTDKDSATIDTNFKGAVAWLNQAALRFSRARSGTIIGISSVAGDRGRRGNPVYNASKAALNSYLESLSNRLRVRGVTVVTAKPGYVQTAMIEGAQLPPLLPAIPAQQAARLILQAAASRRRVAYIPWWWRIIMLITRAVPAPIFERLNV